MKGPEKNKETKEYKIPLNIFDAMRSSSDPTPDNPQTTEENPGKPGIKHDKRIENDFLFPLHLLF